jgi:hypothetical protein
MALAQIPTGSDNTLQLTFEDNAGVAVDLDNATEITVKIYQKKAHILGSYSLTDNTVVIINAKLYAEVSIDITNANFEEGEKRTIVSDIILGEVVVSV